MVSLTQKQAVSLLYFLSFAAMACAGRFMALFFRDDLGLSAGSLSLPPAGCLTMSPVCVCGCVAACFVLAFAWLNGGHLAR